MNSISPWVEKLRLVLTTLKGVIAVSLSRIQELALKSFSIDGDFWFWFVCDCTDLAEFPSLFLFIFIRRCFWIRGYTGFCLCSILIS